MARILEKVTCKKGAWTELTNSDATTVSFEAIDGDGFISPNTSDAQPVNSRGWLYKQGFGEEKKALADLTNVANPTRLFGRPAGDDQQVTFLIDHA